MKLFHKSIIILVSILLSSVISAKGSYQNSISSLSVENSRKLHLERLVLGDGEISDSLKNGLETSEIINPLSEIDDSEKMIVTFDKKLDSDILLKSLASVNYEIVGDISQKTIIISNKSYALVNSVLEKHIVGVENNLLRELHTIPNDEFYSLQWGLTRVNILSAWQITKGNNLAYTCVIDSGIHRSHPDLVYADIRNGWDYVTSDNVKSDNFGHGTMVTGVIAAKTDNYIGISGLNWNVAIIPFRVVQDNGAIYSIHVTQAIYDAADVGCKVINLSLGGPDFSSAEYNAIQYAIAKGSIVIASSGNTGNSIYQYPASQDNVISVASINENNVRSTFSTYNNRVTVTGPGERVATTSNPTYAYGYNQYLYADGTSFSAPHVAGIASLAVALSPQLTASQFKDLLILTSIDLGNIGYDNEYGYGVIDAGNLLSTLNSQLDRVYAIELLTIPTKTSYIYSEPFDPSGGMIRAYKSSGGYIDFPISIDMLSGYDPFTTNFGPQTVTVTYQDGTTAFKVNVDRFIDVPYGHRNYVHINALVGLGIINGYSDNTFRPNNTLTRAQAAIMIVRAIGLSTDGVSSNFNDVPPNHAAYKFISAANQAGIINGYSDGTFKPNANVTRAQIAIMIQRAFNVQASGTVMSFTDVPEGYAPKKFIETLASQKIVNGYSDGTFKPLNNVTRAQFSTMIYNAIQYTNKK